jgi:hypothetical protein
VDVAELVPEVAVRHRGLVALGEQACVVERGQQAQVRRAWLVQAGEQAVDRP